MARAKATARKGFSLAEAGVALFVAAAGAAGVFELAAGAAKTRSQADLLARLTVVAENACLEFAARRPIAGDTQEGEAGEFSWIATARADPSAPSGLITLECEAQGRNKRFALFRWAAPGPIPADPAQEAAP